jgi:hypothetical protein
MEEKELEQTNNESVETITEQNVEETTEKIVEEPTKEPEPMFTEEQVQERINNAVANRLARERKRLDRERKEELSKYQELAYLTQQGLKAESLDDTLKKSREFYGKQGITYIPNNNDDEIIGKAYAEEIISEADSLQELEDTAKKLSSKSNLSNREQVILDNLSSEINSRKRIAELQSIGVTEDEYNSSEFKAFEKKFSKDTPITEVYEIYKKNTNVKPLANPGSMKSVPGNEKKDFITEAEYDKMSEKEIEENLDLIHKSMAKW